MAFKLWQPETPYYLVAATMATIGHNWPIYHRFRGGRGLSPILGGMLAVDWIGVMVTNLMAAAIGIPLKNLLVTSGGGIVLMIPWIWLRTQDWPQLAYVVGMNVIFWGAMIPELKEYARLRREGKLDVLVEAQQIRVVRRVGDQTVNQLRLTDVWNTFTGWFRRKSGEN
jgi:glycerol-3-phosphate acyltransferase PlsY